MPARRLQKDALIQKILDRLTPAADGRALVIADVHLTMLVGVYPNWDVHVDGADPEEVEKTKRALSVYNVARESKTYRAKISADERATRQIESDRALRERLGKEAELRRQKIAALKQARLDRDAAQSSPEPPATPPSRVRKQKSEK